MKHALQCLTPSKNPININCYYRLNCVSSQNSYVDILTPNTQKVTLFGNKVVADVIS